MPSSRAHHSKSRLGCYNCKSRRVKCDETRPACLRCVRSGRTCTPDNRPTEHQRCRQFKSVIFTGPTSPVVVEEDSLRPLEYFHIFTLPLCDISEPSLLWQCVGRDVTSDQTICYIAAALGHQHMRMAQEYIQGYAESSHRLHHRALRSMRKSLSSTPSVRATPIYSLLMAVLQAFHRNQAEMHVHLRYGAHIAEQETVSRANGGDATSPELRESLRLLRKYSTLSSLFDSVGKESNVTAGMVAANNSTDFHDIPLSSLQDDSVLLAELDTLTRRLLQTMRCSRMAQYDGAGNVIIEACHFSKASMESTAACLAANQKVLHDAIEAKLCAELVAPTRMTAHFHFALAQCLLAGIFLRCCWTGSLCAYDVEYPTFRRVIELARDGLTLLPISNAKHSPRAIPFSLGLGAIGTLVYVALLCRDHHIRRNAIEMLACCPSAENLWTVELAQRLCATVVAFEEKLAAEHDELAYQSTRHIPWHCRVHYYSFTNAQLHQLQHGSRALRLFRPADGNVSAFIYDDVPLVDLETALQFMTQKSP